MLGGELPLESLASALHVSQLLRTKLLLVRRLLCLLIASNRCDGAALGAP